MDVYDQLADSVLAIKSDDELRSSFLKILTIGSFTQQVRVEKLRAEIEPLNPPDEVITLLNFLSNDKLANVVRAELEA